MTGALLLARLLLALVFVVAAVGKLPAQGAVRETLTDFGLPRRLSSVGAVVLPLAELAVAGLLLLSATARLGAFAALGLLMVFCAAITRVLRRGEQPDCNCFGKVHSAPIGWRTLARNGALAAMAVLVAAAGPGQGIGDALAGVRVTTVGVVLVLISLAVAFEGFVGWQLFRQNGRLLERVRALEDAAEDRGMRTPEPAGLPVGHPAPTFELADLHGRKRTLADLLAPGLPVALVFSDPDCGACVELAPRLGRLREEHAGSLEIALISRGTPAENRALLGGGRLEDVLLQEDREVLAAFRIDTVPSAMIVDPDGRIATPTATGYPAIEELLASTATPVSERLRVAVG